MADKVIVAGVGMIPFSKPGTSEPYYMMGAQAVTAALADAGLTYDEVQQAYVGYVYGDSTAGQLPLYHVGLTGIPIVNVNNNCSTGSTALFLARQAVASGAVDVAIALGFEEMRPGALNLMYKDRVSALMKHEQATATIQGWDPDVGMSLQYFGGAAVEYQQRYGARTETFAKVAEKARAHAANNPLAIFREKLSVEQILQSAPIFGPLTRLQCCPPTCGAAAAIVVSPAFARRRGIDASVAIVGQEMETDGPASFESGSMIEVIGASMVRRAADRLYENTGIGADDVDVAELHDCFTVNEVVSYETLGFAPQGEAERFIWDGGNTYGGSVVTNPSGGLLSKGHPLGATGLAQCYELTKQLRGAADARQVDGARIALQHNLGLGGACVVTMYARDG